MDKASAPQTKLTATSSPPAARLPAEATGDLLQTQPMSLEQLRKFAEGGYLYAILDACDAPAVPPKMQELGARAVSLFRGTAEEQYSAVAPYLVAIDPATLDWIVENFWAEPWGVFVMSKADLESLRMHLRRFLMVQLPDGEKWFFRYYDPRILKTYLPACSAGELRALFGPVRGFGIAEEQQIAVWSPRLPEHLQDGQDLLDPALLWRIRDEQYQAFTRHAMSDFETRVIAHLNEFFPTQCQALKESDLRDWIRFGLKRAEAYGIVSERGVCFFVDMLFLFGRDFDHDPRLPWAAAILNDPEIKNAEDKIDRLRAAAEPHVNSMVAAEDLKP